MSQSKRLEKEIDYLKFLIGGIVAIVAVLSATMITVAILVLFLIRDLNKKPHKHSN